MADGFDNVFFVKNAQLSVYFTVVLKLLVDFVAPHAAKIVALRIKEQAPDQLACI